MDKFSELVRAYRIALEQSKRGMWSERDQAKRKVADLFDDIISGFGTRNTWDEEDEVAYRWIVDNQ